MTNEQILRAIDDSIKKWQYIVYFKGSLKMTKYKDGACPLCKLFGPDCWYNSEEDFEYDCPIYYFTKEPVCQNTPFYNTSLWTIICNNGYNKFIHKQKFIQDNHMLSVLYDVRRRFIEDINSKRSYYNL